MPTDATVLCMSATPFDADGALDEAAIRAHLRRMADAGVGVYLGSGGAGEGHALSTPELGRLYAIGVSECGGRVPTFANPPESRTAEEMLAKARLAVAAGVDCVQLYAVDGGHGMRPTEAEQELYYRQLLDEIDHPVAISVHPYQDYLTPVPLLTRLARDYPQLVAINVMVRPYNYFVELKDALPARIDFYCVGYDLVQGLSLGAAGCLSAEPNLAPVTFRSIIDRARAGDLDGAGAAQADIIRLGNIVTRWAPSTARWVKMGLKVLGRGNGVLRPPYLLPDEGEQAIMAAAFARLGLPDWEGWTPPGGGR
jgi:4-hydroxy-tetrahydrodipicolinate synthase